MKGFCAAGSVVLPVEEVHQRRKKRGIVRLQFQQFFAILDSSLRIVGPKGGFVNDLENLLASRARGEPLEKTFQVLDKRLGIVLGGTDRILKRLRFLFLRGGLLGSLRLRSGLGRRLLSRLDGPQRNRIQQQQKAQKRGGEEEQ